MIWLIIIKLEIGGQPIHNGLPQCGCMHYVLAKLDCLINEESQYNHGM